MIGKLISLVVVALLAWVIYVTVAGTPEQVKQRNVLFGKVQDLGLEVKNIFSSETKNYQRGDYDKALGKIGNMIDHLRQGDDKGANKTQISDLEKEQKRIQTALDNAPTPEQQKQLQKDLQKLSDNLQSLSNQMK